MNFHPAILTERQRAVVALLADGEPQKAIAATLNLSQKAVEWHIRAAKQRLGIHHMAGLVKWAFANGLSDLSNL